MGLMCLLGLGRHTAAPPLCLLGGANSMGTPACRRSEVRIHTPRCLRAQLHRLKPPGTPWNTTVSLKRVGCSQKCELGCVRPRPLTQNPHGKELKALLGLGAPPPPPQAGLWRGWCEPASLSSHTGSHPGRSHSPALPFRFPRVGRGHLCPAQECVGTRADSRVGWFRVRISPPQGVPRKFLRFFSSKEDTFKSSVYTNGHHSGGGWLGMPKSMALVQIACPIG